MNQRLKLLKTEFDKNRNQISFDEALKFKDDPQKKFYWSCKKFKDSWETSMYNRLIRDRDCPYCSNQRVNNRNCLATTHPHLTDEWDKSQNTKTPYDVVAGSKEKIDWKCIPLKHKWSASINARTRKKDPTGCPYCSHKLPSVEYNLQTEYPEIAKEYDTVQNKSLPTDVLPGSSHSVSWKCLQPDCNYEWISEVRKRTNNREKCPQCYKNEVTLKNCLALTQSNLMLEWDFEKNKLNPFKINTKNSGSKKVHWICNKLQHKYSATIYSRTKSKPSGCPYCSRNKTSIENSVYSHNLLRKEWDKIKNAEYNIKKIAQKSSRPINWICSNIIASTKKKCGYKWEATPANRTGTNETACPKCANTRRQKGTSKKEIIIREALKKIFPSTHNGVYTCSNVKFRNNAATIDIWIEDLKLGIEYDPYHTHKGKEVIDRDKTKILQGNGYQVIRIRQYNLGSIGSAEINFNSKTEVEEIVQLVLEKILLLRPNLPKKTIDAIKNYSFSSSV
jgi:hypothetical protein